MLGISRRKNSGLQVTIPLPDVPSQTDLATATACGGIQQAKYMSELFMCAIDAARNVQIGEAFSLTIKGLGAYVTADPMNFALSLSLLGPSHGLSCRSDAVKGDTITFIRAS